MRNAETYVGLAAAHGDVPVGFEVARERDPEPAILRARGLVAVLATDRLPEVVDAVAAVGVR